MAKNSMDLWGLLRKRGMNGDVDFLREALQVLVDGVIACPVPRHGGWPRCRRRSALSMRSASPTATGIPAGHGTGEKLAGSMACEGDRHTGGLHWSRSRTRRGGCPPRTGRRPARKRVQLGQKRTEVPRQRPVEPWSNQIYQRVTRHRPLSRF